jgi:hypothetical protein
MKFVVDMVEEWQERAAIREYDGGQPRDLAERDAIEDLLRIHGEIPEEILTQIRANLTDRVKFAE